MDEAILRKLEEQDVKLEKIGDGVEKMRKYFLLSLIASVIFFVLPLVGLLLAIPFFLNVISSTTGLV